MLSVIQGGELFSSAWNRSTGHPAGSFKDLLPHQTVFRHIISHENVCGKPKIHNSLLTLRLNEVRTDDRKCHILWKKVLRHSGPLTKAERGCTKNLVNEVTYKPQLASAIAAGWTHPYMLDIVAMTITNALSCFFFFRHGCDSAFYSQEGPPSLTHLPELSSFFQ